MNLFALFIVMAIMALSLQGCTLPKVTSPRAHTVIKTEDPSTPSHIHVDDELGKSRTLKSASPITWSLTPPASPAAVGQPVTLSWQLTDTATQLPIRNFELTHEKRAHFIVVSNDLSVFQHLHPNITGPGTMSVRTALPGARAYTLFLQVKTPEHGEQTLRQTLEVGTAGPSTLAPLVLDANQPKTVEGVTFKLSGLPTVAGQPSLLSLAVEQEGKPATAIAPYLGAGGHMVIISQDTEHFLHVHPMTTANAKGVFASPVQFHTTIDEPGMYRLWAQVMVGGSLKTVAFTFKVGG